MNYSSDLPSDEHAFFYGEAEEDVNLLHDPFNILSDVEEECGTPLIHLEFTL